MDRKLNEAVSFLRFWNWLIRKLWMFDQAEELLSRSEYDKIVCLGDLVDDWDQEKNLGLYSETFDALERFINRHPNFLLCYGNHDVSYIWEARESGYSDYARPVVLEGLSKLEKIIPAGSRTFGYSLLDGFHSTSSNG